MTKENIVKHGCRIPQDLPQAENSNQVSLPVAGEHGSFFYAIYKVIFCNFVLKVTYVTLTSCDTYNRCLQLMFMTMFNILTSNKSIDTFKKYIISLVFCVLLFSIFVG